MNTLVLGSIGRTPTRRAARLALACLAASAVGCFPDDLLRTAQDASVDVHHDDIVTADVVQKDAGEMDAGEMDVVTPDVVDAGVEDVPKVPVDADWCAMVPNGPVPAMPVFSDVSAARDMAFDGRGGLAVTRGNAIHLVARGGGSTPLLPVAAGEVTALRYTASGQIVFAASNLNDAGLVTGGIYVLEPGMTAPTTRWPSTGRVNGLAVNPDGTVFYSDTTAGTIYRFTVGETAMPQVVTRDVPAPRALAFDASGRVLYAGGTNGVYRLSLDPTDGGAARPTQVYGGTDTVTGLAVDTCGNLWIADERPAPLTSRIFRLGMGTEVPIVYESADGVRALAFGQGGAFEGRAIYFLQPGTNAVRSILAVAQGVPRPAPSP